VRHWNYSDGAVYGEQLQVLGECLWHSAAHEHAKFLGTFATFRKAAINFALAICMEQPCTHFHEIWYLSRPISLSCPPESELSLHLNFHLSTSGKFKVSGQVQCLSEAVGHSKDPPQMATVLWTCWQPQVSFLAVSREMKLLNSLTSIALPFSTCQMVLVH